MFLQDKHLFEASALLNVVQASAPAFWYIVLQCDGKTQPEFIQTRMQLINQQNIWADFGLYTCFVQAKSSTRACS